MIILTAWVLSISWISIDKLKWINKQTELGNFRLPPWQFVKCENLIFQISRNLCQLLKCPIRYQFYNFQEGCHREKKSCVCSGLVSGHISFNKHCEVLVSCSGQKSKKYSNLNIPWTLKNLQGPSETFRNLH